MLDESNPQTSEQSTEAPQQPVDFSAAQPALDPVAIPSSPSISQQELLDVAKNARLDWSVRTEAANTLIHQLREQGLLERAPSLEQIANEGALLGFPILVNQEAYRFHKREPETILKTGFVPRPGQEEYTLYDHLENRSSQLTSMTLTEGSESVISTLFGKPDWLLNSVGPDQLQGREVRWDKVHEEPGANAFTQAFTVYEYKAENVSGVHAVADIKGYYGNWLNELTTDVVPVDSIVAYREVQLAAVFTPNDDGTISLHPSKTKISFGSWQDTVPETASS